MPQMRIAALVLLAMLAAIACDTSEKTTAKPARTPPQHAYREKPAGYKAAATRKGDFEFAVPGEYHAGRPKLEFAPRLFKINQGMGRTVPKEERRAVRKALRNGDVVTAFDPATAKPETGQAGTTLTIFCRNVRPGLDGLAEIRTAAKGQPGTEMTEIKVPGGEGVRIKAARNHQGQQGHTTQYHLVGNQTRQCTVNLYTTEYQQNQRTFETIGSTIRYR